MEPLRDRSLALTNLLEKMLKDSSYFVPLSNLANNGSKPGFTIITPADPAQRGAQLSLLFVPIGTGLMQSIFAGLVKRGVIGDEREPDVIRLAPAPLYNTQKDCENAVKALNESFASLV